MIIKRRDKIYHVWHYCPICYKVFDHSQGTWDTYKGEHCKVQWIDVSGDQETIEITDNII